MAMFQPFYTYHNQSKTGTFQEEYSTKWLFSISQYLNWLWIYWPSKKPLYLTSVQTAALRRSCYCTCQNPVQSNLALATLTWRCCGGVWRWVSIPTSLQYHNTQPRQRGARPHTVIVTWRETEMSCWTGSCARRHSARTLRPLTFMFRAAKKTIFGTITAKMAWWYSVP